MATRTTTCVPFSDLSRPSRPDASRPQPHYLSEQTRAMEDSRWSLMRPRLDHYARAAFPRLSMTDANFDEQYRTTEARLDRLEQYVGETDCEVLRVKLDHDIDELDERLRVVRPESLDFQQQLRQLNKEYELDKVRPTSLSVSA